MVKDAEAYAEEDRKRREAVETRNRGDQLVHQTEKVLSEQGDNLNDEEKSGIESALADLKGALGDESTDSSEIQSKMDALVEASQNAFTRVYQEAAAAADAEAGPTGEAGDDEDIVEAEIVDEDE